MNLKSCVKKILIKSNYYRNRQTIHIAGVNKNRVNLEYWIHAKNLGDCLSPVVVNWLLNKKGMSLETRIKGIKHLYAIGSVIGMGGSFDATIWGSGLHNKEAIEKISKERNLRKYDIRAVRGPKTAEVMRNAGYVCPSVFGDPAVLMSEIYKPKAINVMYDYSVIHHYTKKTDSISSGSIQEINILTEDYQQFINKILRSQCVISSSLHGIILAETYGIPAIFLNEGMDNEMFKYIDWYYSTGRKSIVMATSISDAMKKKPMGIPDLSEMRRSLLETFPYDLWTA